MTKDIKSILVIRLSSMGDVILTSALLRMLNEQLPETAIDFLVSEPFAKILDHNPRVDFLLKYDKSINFKEISKRKSKQLSFSSASETDGKYDVIIDLQNNLRSRYYCKGIGREIFSVNKHRLNKLSLVYRKKPIIKKLLPIPEVYLETIKELGIIDDKKPLELWLPGEAELGYYPPVRKKFNEENKRIAIAPGAAHFTKRWQVEKYLDLIERLHDDYGAEIFLIGGKADVETTNFVLNNSKITIEDFSGSTSIIETAKIVDQCSLLITNDTGVMHIAAARQTPVIAIFGSSVRDFGFAPYRVPSVIVEKEVSCRPCSHIGREKCPKKHFKCMKNILVEDILKHF